jgi:probable rRNA maturation factor
LVSKKDWPRCELSVLITDDPEIKKLNRYYRKRNRATDVLSFVQLGKKSKDPKEPLLLGDVVISAQTAKRQAKERKHSIEKELVFLLIHGILHLFGYDHNIP